MSDSEEEVEAPGSVSRREGVEILGEGFNLKEILETKETSFSVLEDNMLALIDSEDDDEELRGTTMPTMKRKKIMDTIDLVRIRREVFGHKEQKEVKELDGTNWDFNDLARLMKDVDAPGVVKGDVKKRILSPGWGGLMQAGSLVYFDFLITYEAGDETMYRQAIIDTNRPYFDNSMRRGDPFRHKIGAGGVLPIFEIALGNMEPHETSQFMATCKYAYGKAGLYGHVPPNTTILIEIMVLRVEDGTQKVKIWDMDAEERRQLPFSEILLAAQELKIIGNDHYKIGEYDRARIRYKKALRLISAVITPLYQEVRQKNELSHTLLSNMAQCKVEEKEFRRAQQYLREALKIPIPDVLKLKAYFRMAICNREVGEFTEALRNAELAKAIDSANTDISELFQSLQIKAAKDVVREKEYAKRMLGNMENKSSPKEQNGNGDSVDP